MPDTALKAVRDYLSTLEKKGVRELFLRLKSKGVICSFREGYIRFSPHFFNTQEEIEALFSYL